MMQHFMEGTIPYSVLVACSTEDFHSIFRAVCVKKAEAMENSSLGGPSKAASVVISKETHKKLTMISFTIALDIISALDCQSRLCT